MLGNGWKRLLSGLLALVLVIGMLPPVSVAAEETEAMEVMEVPETEPVIIEPVETEPAETTVATEAVTEPAETTVATEETVPETTAETVVATTEATEATLPENVAAVQALIDALPTVDSVTEDDYDAVQAAFDAYEALTEEEKALIQGAEVFEALFAWFNAQISTLDTVASGTCGENLTWVLDTQGKLTISGTGDMTDYYYSNVPWYSNRGNVASVVIENGVTSIGRFAFYECSKLVRVTIPESVISIGDSAFDSCSSLASISIPASVTSVKGGAFDWCSALTGIFVDSANPCYLSDSGVLFNKEKNQLIRAPGGILGSYQIPEGVTRICDDAFFGCGNLTKVTIPEGVTRIGSEAFKYCVSLTGVTIPESVTTIESLAFYSCDSLTCITIPESVASIGTSAFSNCDKLTEILVAEGNENFVSIDGILYNAEKSKFVAVPEGITGSVTIPGGITSIGNSEFYSCSSLTGITIPESVTSIGNSAFDSCSKLTEILVAEGNEHFVSIEGILYNAEKTKIVAVPRAVTGSVTIPSGITSIGDSAFYGCKKFTSITIPESVTSIGNSAFYSCDSLTSITIPEGVTSIGKSAFYSCDSLTSITIPASIASIGDSAFQYCNFLDDVYYIGTPELWNTISIGSENTCLTNATIHMYYDVAKGTCGENVTWVLDSEGLLSISGTGDMTDYSSSVTAPSAPWDYYKDSISSVAISEGVTSIGSAAFYTCKSLISITIPESVTSIGNSAFGYCVELRRITIPESVASIGTYAFSNCESLSSITIPKGITSIANGTFYCCYSLSSITIPDSVASIGISAFNRCSNLSSITIPDGITSLGDNTFLYCKKLSSITIPESVTSMGNYVFYGCSSLSSIIIPEGVTSIGEYTFHNCTSLTSITIPMSVTNISQYAFYNCGKLSDVYYDGTQEQWNAISIDDSGNGLLTRATIHIDTAVVTAPTCTERGYTTHTCAGCGKSYVDEDSYVDALGHAEVTDEAAAPTCTKTGLTEGKHCSVCDAVLVAQKTIPANGHTEVIDMGLAATCTEDGLTEGKHCSVCNEVLVAQEVIPASHSYESTVTDPTCTEQGYTTHTCTVCGDSYVDTYVDATGHTEAVDKAVEPTCTKTGLTEGKHCSVCNEVLVAQNVVPANGHNHKATVTDPTCTEQGYTTHTCTGCGDTYVDTYVDATGHTEVTDEAVAPNCTETGLTEGKHCSVCNEVLVAQKTVPANGHNHKATVTDPTCTEQGYTTHTCTGCGDTYVDTYVDATGHTEVTDEAVAPNCTETGLTEGKHCSVCNEVLVAQKTVPANGHNHKATVTDPTCTEQGYTTHTCTACGDSYVDSYVDATGHTEAIDKAVDPTCTETGLTEGKHCSVCNEVLVAQEVVPANDHNYEDVVTDPTCTEQGYTTHTCTGCGDSYVDTYVDAQGHDVTLVEAVEPTYFELGNYAYYQCERCEKLFADADATQETTLEDQQIPMLDSIAAGTCGENLTWVLTEDGTLTISGIGEMEDYNWGGMPWSSYRGTITSVVIEEGVSSIGDRAFDGCRSLVSVTIPEGVTSIGRYAFNDCDNLSSVTIPASVTSIGSYAFQRCNNLTHITFAHRATDELTIGSMAFYMESYSHNNTEYCPTTVVVASAKYVHPAISQCSWGYRTLTYISAMELPAQSMTIQAEKSEAEVGIEIPTTLKVEPADTTSDILWSVIPGTGTATVTRQGVVTGLTAGTVTVRATSGDSADIYAEASLTILPPSGGDPTAISVIAGGLYENEVAVDETIPMQVVFTPANASSRNVTWEVHNGTGTAKIDENGNLTGLTPGSVTVYATTANGIENSCTVNVVRYAESIQIFLDGKSDTTSMGVGETKYLTAVLTPENTSTTGVYWSVIRGTGAAELDWDDNYYYDGGHTTVTWITGTEAGTVTVVATAKDSHAVVAKAELEITDTIRSYAVTGGNIYYNTETGWITGSDNTVTNAVIPSKIEGTTIVGIASDAFANVNNSWHNYYKNTALTSVSIPATVKEIGHRAFYNCTALSNLRFAGTSQLTTIGEGAFYDCESLTSLTVPESVATVGDEAFYGLSGLKNLTISGEMDSINWGFGEYRSEALESITYTGSYIRSGAGTAYPGGGYYAQSYVFSYAKKLILSDSITNIGDYAFTGGYNATEIVLGDHITSIGKYAFSGFYQLTAINLPDSLTTISQYAFSDCRQLATINLPESLTYLGEGCFEDCPKLNVVDLSQIPDTISDARYLLDGKATLPDHIIKATNGKVSFYWDAWSATDDYTYDPYSIAYVSHYANGKMYLECLSSGQIKLTCQDEYTGLQSSKIIEIKAGLQIRPTDLGYLTSGQNVTLSAWMMPSGTKTSVNWFLSEGDEAYATLTSAGNLTAKAVTSAKQITVNAMPYSGGETVTKSIWILPKTTNLSITQNGDPLTAETEVDMHQSTTLDLAATTAPADASNDVTWSTSNENVAMVNENGEVTLLKPGTVTITATATDGSKKSAKVTLTVYYLDKATKLTATSDAPDIGLQPGQTANITISGSKELPQEKLYFSIPASQQHIATVDKDTGVVTAGNTPGTVTVTATLRDDPLNRTATCKIKVIDMQAEVLEVSADVGETAKFEENTVILDALTVKDNAYTFTVSATGKNHMGGEFTPAVTWASSNTAIATVKTDKDGITTVTVKKSAGGECAITATAKDLGKASANLWLSVRDYQPRLETSNPTMNLCQRSSVDVTLLESYGNTIESVSVNDNFDAAWEADVLTLTAQEGVKKGTYTQTLTVTCGNGETYSYTLKIKVTETAPTVTVKQSGKYNLFYNDGTATLNVTAKGTTVTDVSVTGGDFYGEYEDGVLTLTANGEGAPDKKVTLEIEVAGYEKPVEKTVTLATVTTAPKLKLSSASSIINTNYGSQSTTFQVLNGTEVLDLTGLDITYSGDFADYSVDGDAITLELNGTKGGTATLLVQDSNWTKSVKLTHKVTVQTALPTLKLGATTLKLNKVFPDLGAETTVSLSQGNLILSTLDITSTAKAGSALADEAEKLSVDWDGENGITVTITDETIKNGAYVFNCVGTLENGTVLKTVTLKITVSSTTPKVKLASTTFKLNRNLAGKESISTKVTVPAGYTLDGFDGIESTPLDYADGYLTACLTGEEDVGSTYTIYPILIPDGSEEPITLTSGLKVKITTYTAKVTATVTTKGKLDVLNPGSAIACTVKLKNCAGTISNDISLSGQDGDLFSAEVLDGKVIVTLKDDKDYATDKTYKVTLDMNACGQDVSANISFKVTQSALKLALTPSSMTCYQAIGYGSTTLKLTSPVTAEIDSVTLSTKTTAAFRKALGENEMQFDLETGRITFHLAHPGLLTPGKSYTVYLDITPENAATNVKPTQVKLTVKVKS